MKKQTAQSNKNLQDRFLSTLIREKTRVWLYLVGGVRLEGYIKYFDTYVIYLDEPVLQLVYKRSVCSVMPVQTHKKNSYISSKILRAAEEI